LDRISASTAPLDLVDQVTIGCTAIHRPASMRSNAAPSVSRACFARSTRSTSVFCARVKLRTSIARDTMSSSASSLMGLVR
jgi:hypothetical protein